MSQWKRGAERVLYEDQWLYVTGCDVTLPDGRHLDHRIIRGAIGAGALVVVDEQVLLLWRHRFITDTYGWEIPIGGIRAGEDPAAAAAREVEEETGWRPGPLRPLVYSQPTPGLMTSEHHIFRADEATYVGEPEDGFESERVEWLALRDVRREIDKRHITAGTTLVALLYLLTEPSA